MRIFPHAGELPLFNPDHDAHPPHVVQELYAWVDDCDAVVIASPEYAHGITGTMKNMLDWLVGYASFANTPVAVLNASPASVHADAALKEVLITMSAVVVPDASIRVPLAGTPRTEEFMVHDTVVARAISEALQALRVATQQYHAPNGWTL